ncbi:hypothetical protein QJS66_17980 [Kocuria rhizophila]|nr:hypothetical protein QJS66_17980 [Kocuria rhizophila]
MAAVRHARENGAGRRVHARLHTASWRCATSSAICARTAPGAAHLVTPEPSADPSRTSQARGLRDRPRAHGWAATSPYHGTCCERMQCG